MPALASNIWSLKWSVPSQSHEQLDDISNFTQCEPQRTFDTLIFPRNCKKKYVQKIPKILNTGLPLIQNNQGTSTFEFLNPPPPSPQLRKHNQLINQLEYFPPQRKVWIRFNESSTDSFCLTTPSISQTSRQPSRINKAVAVPIARLLQRRVWISEKPASTQDSHFTGSRAQSRSPIHSSRAHVSIDESAWINSYRR